VSELQQLPFSCWHSAEALERQRKIYEEYDIFPPKIVDGLIRYLKSFNDQNLRESIKDNEKEIMKLVNAYLHCG
jgi:glutamine synthetase